MAAKAFPYFYVANQTFLVYTIEKMLRRTLDGLNSWLVETIALLVAGAV